MKQFYFLILISGAVSFGEVSGTLGLQGGFSFDRIRLWGERLGDELEDKTTNIHGALAELAGRVRLNQLYLRSEFYYTKTFSTPQHLSHLAGVPSWPTYLPKRYGKGFSSALGYLFALGKEFSIGPEFGYMNKRIMIDFGAFEVAKSFFVGFESTWTDAKKWRARFALDAYMLGWRKSEFIRDVMFIPFVTRVGRYYGSDLRLGADYTFCQWISLGLDYRFQFLQTTKKPMSRLFVGTRNRWTTQRITAALNMEF